MAQHHVHWGTSDVKWLGLAVLVLYLVARPKKTPSPHPTIPIPGDDYVDSNGATWSRENLVGTTKWLGQALTGPYAGQEVGPFGSVQELLVNIDTFAAANKGK